jgi:HEAT repeat protein
MPRPGYVRETLLVWLVIAGSIPAQDTGFLGKPMTRWAEELTSSDARVRRSAAFALGKTGALAIYTVPRLVRALKDPDAGVRQAAAFALGEIGPAAWQSAYPALLEVLSHDSDSLARRSAALALGNLGKLALTDEDNAVPVVCQALEKALADPDAAVRQNAVWALGRIASKKADAAVSSLCQALADSDSLVRRDAALALAEFGSSAHAAVPALLDRFQQERDSATRKTTLTVLVNLVGPDDQAVAAELRAALEDKDRELARTAGLGLANIGGPGARAAVPALCEALHEGEADVRRQAAAALAHLGPKAAAAVAGLAQALADTDPVVRRNAALALSRIGKKAEPAVPALAKLLAARDEPDEIRMFAAEALWQISPAVQPAVPVLLQVVKEDPNYRLRQRAILALAHLDDPEKAGAIDAFTAVLSETAPESRLVRYDAAVVLGILLGPRAPEKTVDVLLEYLRDKNIQTYLGSDAKPSGAGREARTPEAILTPNFANDCRYQAALALGRIGPKANRPEIVQLLKEAAEAPEAKLHAAAEEALRSIQGLAP